MESIPTRSFNKRANLKAAYTIHIDHPHRIVLLTTNQAVLLLDSKLKMSKQDKASKYGIIYKDFWKENTKNKSDTAFYKIMKSREI